MAEQVKVDFRQLKTIPIEQVLEHYDVQYRRAGEQLTADCPLPTHTSRSRASFRVNWNKNIWCCKSDSCADAYKEKLRGKRGGDCLDLVALKEGVGIRQAALLLLEWFPKEKAPQIGGPDVSHGNIPTRQSNDSNPNGNGKLRYMQQIDEWFDCVIRRGDQEDNEETYYHRIRNAIKSKLIESYRAGKQAVQSQT